MRWPCLAALLATACSSVPVSDAGLPDCEAGQTRCGTACVDVKRDDAHCGVCGTRCGAGTSCAGGVCFPDDCPEADCSLVQACVARACQERACVGVVCPDGFTCYLGTCSTTQCGSTSCERGLACVSGACADTSCLGVVCPQGRQCERGACIESCDGGGCAPPTCDGGACACDGGTCAAPPCDGGTCACDGGVCMRPTPTSCAALLAADPSAGDGLVALDPDGPGGSTPFIAFCLMSVQGGGWTQVASLSGAGVLTDSSVGSFATDPFKLSTATINRLFANAADRRVLMDFGQGQLMEFKFASPWGVAAFQSPMWSYPPATSWFGPCATPASGIGAPSLIWIRAACPRLPDGGSASCACAASGHESGLFGSGFVSSDNAQVFPGLGWSSDFKVYVR